MTNGSRGQEPGLCAPLPLSIPTTSPLCTVLFPGVNSSVLTLFLGVFFSLIFPLSSYLFGTRNRKFFVYFCRILYFSPFGSSIEHLESFRFYLRTIPQGPPQDPSHLVYSILLKHFVPGDALSEYSPPCNHTSLYQLQQCTLCMFHFF